MIFDNPTPAEQGHVPLPDIDLRKLFEQAKRAVPEGLPTLVDCGGVFFLTLAPTDRLSIATTIERLIDALDALEPDPDLEPWLGAGDDREDDTSDDEPTMGSSNDHHGGGSQANWASGMFLADECEEENEHGGDIQDEPHDASDEGNDEPTLGWSNQSGQGHRREEGWAPGDPNDCSYHGGLDFRGDGYWAARKALRNLSSQRPDRKQRYVAVSPGIGIYGALDVDGLNIIGKSRCEARS